MKKLRNAKIITIIFHGFIVIIAGHGIALMCISDIFFPYLLIIGELQFDFSTQNDLNLIPWAILSSFIGKVIIILSLFITHKLRKHWISIFGLLLLVLSFVCILFTNEDSLFIISFLSGSPFLLYLVRSLYLIYNFRKENNDL